jgi:hypothetical protein
VAAQPGVKLADPQPARPLISSRAAGRPVLLATLDVPFDDDAVSFAVDSAVELGERLIVANFVERAPLPLSAMLGYDDLPYTAEMTQALTAPVRLATRAGLAVTRLRIKSFHPIPAMVQVSAEEQPGIFVFGPDPGQIPRLRYRRAARALRSGVTSLVWLAP